MTVRADHDLILSLLKAFGIDTDRLTAVSIRAEKDEVTCVVASYAVLGADGFLAETDREFHVYEVEP